MNRTIRLLLILNLAFASLASARRTGCRSKTLPPVLWLCIASHEATFDAFLKKMFGYDQNMTWKITGIKPSEAPGISNSQQSSTRLRVSR